MDFLVVILIIMKVLVCVLSDLSVVLNVDLEDVNVSSSAESCKKKKCPQHNKK